MPAAVLLSIASVTAGALGAQPAPPLATTDPVDASGPVDLRSATLVQQGANLVLEASTTGPWTFSQLNAKKGRSLCVALFPPSAPTASGRVCFGTLRQKPAARFQALDASGQPGAAKALVGTVAQPSPGSVRASFAAADVGLQAGAFSWLLTSTWSGPPGCDPSGQPLAPSTAPCADSLPDKGSIASQLAPSKVVGCTSRPGFYTNAPRTQKAVALTFDDGPWPDTKDFVRVLESEHVPGTFFLIGEQIRPYGALLRQELADGDMIANHTYTHADVSGGGASARSQLVRTTAAIKAATGGFTPCIFRPPYGASSNALVGLAGSLAMATIEWDVDPTDYSRPGAGVIMSRLLAGAHNGSILLMHDGGGNRSQTLAQLPGLIRALKARGYAFETVTDLLGFPLTYG